MVLSRKRLERIQEFMVQSNIGTILIPLGINFRYLFGQLEEPSERLLLGIIHGDDPPKLLTPSFEKSRMKKVTGVSDVIGWEETQNPYKILADQINHDKQKHIAIEPKMWFAVYNKIAQFLEGYSFTSAENVFDSTRAEKDESEQQFILTASQKTADTIVKVLDELEIGLTESEVLNILKEKLSWGSTEKTFSLVQFGENSSLPHYHGGDRKLQKDTVVLIDAGGSLNNYWGDITITTVFGKASSKFKEIFDIVFKANMKAKEAAAENRIPSEIDAAARKYITKKGYGDFFTHRTGHGIGLEVHEQPYIVENNHTPLKSGNTFTIEPGIYIPDKFGVRIEDNVIKTAEGINTSEIARYELLEI